MTRHFAARVILASALLVPVVAGAAPGRLPQSTEVAASQSELLFTVNPLNPEHTKLVVTYQGGGTLSLDASLVNLTYTATGLVVDMKGPGTFTINGKMGPVTDLGTARLTFKDGKLVKMDHSEGGRTFPCPPARNVGQPGCAGGNSSGS